MKPNITILVGLLAVVNCAPIINQGTRYVDGAVYFMNDGSTTSITPVMTRSEDEEHIDLVATKTKYRVTHFINTRNPSSRLQCIMPVRVRLHTRACRTLLLATNRICWQSSTYSTIWPGNWTSRSDDATLDNSVLINFQVLPVRLIIRKLARVMSTNGILEAMKNLIIQIWTPWIYFEAAQPYRGYINKEW